jgi:hypothetical protein
MLSDLATSFLHLTSIISEMILHYIQLSSHNFWRIAYYKIAMEGRLISLIMLTIYHVMGFSFFSGNLITSARADIYLWLKTSSSTVAYMLKSTVA